MSIPTQSNSKISPKDKRDRTELEQFLRFYLEPHTTSMLSVAQIAEVLKIGIGQIAPIPHLPAWVMGVYNWRGSVLWMVDLGLLLGLDSWYRSERASANYTAIVLKCDRTSTTARLGLVVTRVEDIEWCDTAQIHALPTMKAASALAPYLRGVLAKIR